MAARVATKGSASLVSWCRIIHLGRKPVSGGRPPKDSKTMGKMAVIIGALVEEVASALIVVEDVVLRVRKAAEVITK